MKLALVIPACDAVRRGVWEEVLDAVDSQELRPDARILIDSGSVDRTAELAAGRGWEVVSIRREEFDHGRTRDLIVRRLDRAGFDTVVFLSQDVILASPDALGKLVAFLYDHPVAACYGKQTVRENHPFGAWQQHRSYPDVSRVKTIADAPRSGLLTPFCSNAFAAWKIADVISAGGFPRTRFGEDMLLAAKILEAGGSVGYCASAVAIHEHPETPGALFRRGWSVGRFHAEHPELLRRFGPVRKTFAGGDDKPPFLPFLAKSFGYAAGRFRDVLVPGLLFALMWLLLLPAIRCYDFPQRDVAGRYAPMAEAFASGEWRFAFHPRVTPLLPLFAGIVARVFRCGGVLACQLAGALALTCGVFPLYRGCAKVYGGRVAGWTLLLYAGCSSLLRLGYYGLRDALGVFGMILLFYAAAELWTRPGKRSGWLLFAVAEAWLLLTRGDLALFVLAAFLAFLRWEIGRFRTLRRSAAVAGIVLALLSPCLVYNYRTIGYPVPEVRHAAILRSLCRKLPFLKIMENPRPAIPLDIGVPGESENE